MLASITPERERARAAPTHGTPTPESAPTHPRRHQWTGDRVASLVAVVVLGWLGWWAAAAGFVDLLTADGASRPVVGTIGLGVLVVWTLVATTIYAGDHVYMRRAPSRAWRIVGIAVLLGLLVAGIPAFTAYLAGSL